MIDIKKKLKDLENEEKKLAEKKRQLIEEQKQLEEKQQKLEELFEKSGYSTPKELVEDLIVKYSIRLASLGGGEGQPKRTRTRITAQLRDAVNADIDAGNTKVAASKKHGISYVVVGKIAKGDYNHL